MVNFCTSLYFLCMFCMILLVNIILYWYKDSCHYFWTSPDHWYILYCVLCYTVQLTVSSGRASLTCIHRWSTALRLSVPKSALLCTTLWCSTRTCWHHPLLAVQRTAPYSIHLSLSCCRGLLDNDHISVGGNAVTSFSPSVCFHSIFGTSWPTTDLELLNVSSSWP